MKQGLIKQLVQNLIVLLLLFVLPVITFGQTPPPPGGSGGLPDSPLGVPFDSHMNLLLLFAGIVFATVVIMRIHVNKAAKKLAK
jgi:hypothetical protein